MDIRTGFHQHGDFAMILYDMPCKIITGTKTQAAMIRFFIFSSSLICKVYLLHTAETTVSALISQNGAIQFCRGEIRPIRLRKPEFRIGRQPKQKIAEP